jgi:hypothetical protein
MMKNLSKLLIGVDLIKLVILASIILVKHKILPI